MKPSDAKLHELATRLAGLQKRAKALGVFGNDRELLECPRCGLMEDVTSTGLLITCRASALGEDTGLRFVPLAEDIFRCPSCAQRVEAPAGKLKRRANNWRRGNENHQPARRTRQSR